MTDYGNGYCVECGGVMTFVGDISTTRLYVCVDCFAEKTEFLGYEDCEHKFNVREECELCGECV
jgi:hypothetical protein